MTKQIAIARSSTIESANTMYESTSFAWIIDASEPSQRSRLHAKAFSASIPSETTAAIARSGIFQRAPSLFGRSARMSTGGTRIATALIAKRIDCTVISTVAEIAMPLSTERVIGSRKVVASAMMVIARRKSTRTKKNSGLKSEKVKLLYARYRTRCDALSCDCSNAARLRMRQATQQTQRQHRPPCTVPEDFTTMASPPGTGASSGGAAVASTICGASISAGTSHCTVPPELE